MRRARAIKASGKTAKGTVLAGKETGIKIRSKHWFQHQMKRRMKREGAKLEGYSKKTTFCKIKVGRKTIPYMVVQKLKRNSVAKILAPIELPKQIAFFSQLREIEAVKPHIPPTTRRIKINGEHGLLVTDLTQRGKYLVKSFNAPKRPTRNIDYLLKNFANAVELQEKVETLKQVAYLHTGVVLYDDAFLVQVDPKTNKGIKVWIVDVEFSLR
ncbi:hypothetical protein KKE06_04615 [Candidatus Micrarchaeota archaeon]|nr:hypothetical protein [Candidatus Micrarchaeota archaeon]MBU1930534.1 hypothetical protein [Candidatus Micrarchaeota archaeon]